MVGDTFRLAGYPECWQQPVVAAYLAAGEPAAVAGTAALALWNLGGPPGRPEIVVPLNRQPRLSGVKVTRTRRWTTGEIVSLGCLQVTGPMRTLLDVAPRLVAAELEVALDAAHRRRLVDVGRFSRYLETAARAGVPGGSLLLSLVRVRSPGRAIESAAETMLFRALRLAGLPLPVPQYWTQTRSGRRRIDFAYPDARVALEVDGWMAHDGRSSFDGDRARFNELEDAGWRQRHITWTMLKDDPVEVAYIVGRALGLRPRTWR